MNQAVNAVAGSIKQKAQALSDVMRGAALGAKAGFLPWNQYLVGGDSKLYDEWLGKGLCHGLSIHFLKYEKSKDDFNGAVTLESLDFKDQYQRSDLANNIFDSAVAGNTKFGHKDDLHKHMRKHGFEYLETESFGSTFSGFSHTRFARYVGHSNFFYMVSVPGHAMACAAVKGRKVFFDPNAGIAVCKDMEQLTSFSTTYFASPLVKKNYGDGKKIVLEAKRYRPV